MMTVPPLLARRRSPPDWFERNWKWLVMLALILGTLAWVIFGSTFLAVKELSDSHEKAVALARANPEVTAALGSPIEERNYSFGSVPVPDEGKDAELDIPIHGPKGDGVIRLWGKKNSGKWRLDRITVEVEATKKSIDLTEARR